MSVTLLTPINKICFLCELDRIELATSGETSVTFEVRQSDVIFNNVYYPDNNGRIVIYDLDKLLEPYIDIDSPIGAQFYFTANDVHLVNSSNVHSPGCIILQSTAAVAERASTFVPDFFLTAMMHERNTTVGRFEAVALLNDEDEAITALATYYSESNGLQTRLHNITTVNGFTHVNVSPILFVDESLGQLVGYVVQCGKRKARYRVLPTMPEADPAIIFRNSFGCWETIYLTGAKTQNPKFTRATAIIDGKFTAYDITEEMSWTALTGPLRNGMVTLANELARSKAVFLLGNNGMAGDEIVITDCDLKADNADSIPNFEFSYRRANRRTALIETVRPPRIFDDSFDTHFE